MRLRYPLRGASAPRLKMHEGTTSVFWEVGPGRGEEFLARGYKLRHFFPHRIYYVPKCGPDGFKLGTRMCGLAQPRAMWEVLLYADPALLDQFPAELFFDGDIVWHQQQFGVPGQVASASLILVGDTVHALTFVSDLFQRISRRRDQKTRVERVFKGWTHMLLNAVLHFAREQGARRVRIASAGLAGRHTDRRRQVDLTIFGRIYDHTVGSLFPVAADGEWWSVELDEIGERIVRPVRAVDRRPPERTLCICHDIERGLGHVDLDPGFARQADRDAPHALVQMREVERELGVRATYSVVGTLMDDVRRDVEGDGHCVAFHSFDHRIEKGEQLERCRRIDYRIKGYRPPRSRITTELTDRNLLFHNFEWLASSPRSLDVSMPVLRDGLVRLPIALDDFHLHTEAMQWAQWESRALELIAGGDFTAISLHDCYAGHWLPHYREFLERAAELGSLRTLDEAAAAVTLGAAV